MFLNSLYKIGIFVPWVNTNIKLRLSVPRTLSDLPRYLPGGLYVIFTNVCNTSYI